ncbi:MAG: c-type cytochrome biogenesis protein CcsB [Lentisphaerae bacterium]|nr:c-type cytochrome biogenesis protein CcsB [Lentisphaerota bacterium]
MTLLFNLSLVACLLALIVAAVNLFVPRRPLAGAVTLLLTLGVLGLTGYLGWRWLEAGRPPFGNMFESLVVLAWAVVVVYLALRAARRIPVLGTATALLATLVLAYASAFESDIQPLMPALRSNWLTFHVFTCMLGYGAFAVSFLAAIGHLITARTLSRASPEVRGAFEIITARTISFGFLFLSVGIITGAVWANSAWGTYWSWDPKETWSLITWLVYAIYLHCRFMRLWLGRRAAWIAIIGFICVLITYVGVNFLMKSVHSYAS